jgi:hypothetical protein
MKICWEPSVYVGQAPTICIICSCRAEPVRVRGSQYLIAVVYDDHGTLRGEACRSCAHSSPHQIHECLQERITSLQAQLTELQAMASEPVQTPSLEAEFKSHSQGLP